MIDHSFALIAYEDSPYLSDCLESLKNQTVESEIYISTSTPSQYISEIAKKYNVKVFVTSSGKGIAHDWNFGLHQAKTKYVTLAHQDDLYMPEYTELCLKASEKVKDPLICFTGYVEIIGGKDRSNTLLLSVKLLILWFFMPFKKVVHSTFWKKKFLSFGCPIAAPSVMYNLDKLADFQFSDGFSINMDWDAWYRMSSIPGSFVHVNKTLLKHRIHQDSATSAGLESHSRQNEDLIMFKRFWPDFLSNIVAKIYSLGYKSNDNQIKH